MKIDIDKWKTSEINRWLNLFPGFLAQQLENKKETALKRAQTHLWQIFHYWYFLRIPSEEISPCGILSFTKKVEKWPQGGNFFAIPKLSFVGTEFKIACEIDYLKFDEQPLWVDLNARLADNQSHVFSLPDRWYFQQLENIGEILKKQKITKLSLGSNDLKIFWQAFLMTTLGKWWEIDLILQNSFSLDDWFSFWQKLLVKAEDDWVGIEEIVDPLTQMVRKKFPIWGFTTEEMAKFDLSKPLKKEALDNEVQGLSAALFGIHLDKYFFTPFSGSIFLIEPYYQDERTFLSNLNGILDRDLDEPTPLYNPCSQFALTDFGQWFLGKIL